jgi:hypothetical protein
MPIKVKDWKPEKLNHQREEKRMMKWGITFLDELQKMKVAMDREWNDLFEKSPGKNEEEAWQWVEKLPKFEGARIRNLKSRSNRTIKIF